MPLEMNSQSLDVLTKSTQGSRGGNSQEQSGSEGDRFLSKYEGSCVN